MKRKLLSLMLTLSILISLFPSIEVHADVAPPQTPPGASLNPGDETTQVRMMAETVVLNVRQDPQDDTGAIADTLATFTMRNLGTTEESMQARFPLSFFGGDSDGFGNFPEIDQIAVKIDGNSVSTNRIMQPAISSRGSAYIERAEVPWASFDVAFPPGKDVTIEVAYTTSGYGYYPYEVFTYILETGAGWKDTIGSADIIVRLPYEASEFNVWLPDETTIYSETSPGAVLSGNEVRWHFENLEPTEENNIKITVVTPTLWQNVLNEMDTVSKNQNDGEAWGRLGKDYKEALTLAKGYPRNDSIGFKDFDLSRQAYEKCLSLLPNDALWQYGYADLLWSHYYYFLYMAGEQDTENLLPRTLTALKTSLELDPNNQRAKDLASWISGSIPGSVSVTDSGYDFLALTATPNPPQPLLFVTETPIPSPTVEVISSPMPVPAHPSPVPTDQPTGSPICGGAAFLVPFLVLVLWWKRKMI